jgi:2-oxoglutarate/2-oxoacid ferredoxin oxidoreductase subunit alpha
VLACRSPADCFDVAQGGLADRRSVYDARRDRLSDGYIANGAEPWRIPRFADLPKIPVEHPGRWRTARPFYPYRGTSGWRGLGRCQARPG